MIVTSLTIAFDDDEEEDEEEKEEKENDDDRIEEYLFSNHC